MRVHKTPRCPQGRSTCRSRAADVSHILRVGSVLMQLDVLHITIVVPLSFWVEMMDRSDSYLLLLLCVFKIK